jgi:hypothetical protein
MATAAQSEHAKDRGLESSWEESIDWSQPRINGDKVSEILHSVAN